MIPSYQAPALFIQLIFYLVAMASFQENDNTPLEHTPSNPPFANYERNPFFLPVGKGCSGCVPVRCVETTLDTLQETNISPKNGILKMIFLFPRWDMLIPWRVSHVANSTEFSPWDPQPSGLPLTFGIDDLTKFFSSYGQARGTNKTKRWLRWSTPNESVKHPGRLTAGT